MIIPVSKYHGCGNDFVIAAMNDVCSFDLSAFAIAVCDRHTGIGADGFIAVKQDPFEMVFYNQDGSRAPMCGNGIRCFAAYCMDEHLCENTCFDVETLAGIQEVEITENPPYWVSVDMGLPKEDLSLLGIKEPIWGKELTVSTGQQVTLYSIFMGTIHTVVFTPHDSFDLAKVGKEICEHPLFAYETNVNFVEIIDETQMNIRTYERGVGMTLACGTGACASLICGHRLQRLGKQVVAHLPKGELQLSIESDGHVKMRGPAVRIMKGVYEYEGN